MKLWLGGLIVSLGLGALPTPAQAQVSSAQVNALVEAIRQAAPQTGPNKDGVYSDWQILPGNIPRWTKFCTGQTATPEQFGSNPQLARQVVTCIVKDALEDEYPASGNQEAIAVQRVAAWWMTGEPGRYTNPATSPYTQKVLSFYQQNKSGGSNSTTRATATPQRSAASNAAPQETPVTAQGAETSEYDRYMEAGYAASKKGDYPQALLNFQRALDERPNDSYAQKAVQNVQGYLTKSRSNPNSSKPSTNQKAPANQKPLISEPPKPSNNSPQPASPQSNRVVVPAQPVSYTPNAGISQQQAVDLVNQWLQAKSEIFAPPFDSQSVQQLTTGELYRSLTEPEGAIAWLKDNEAYYRFGVQKVESVERFAAGPRKATVEIKITEDRTLYRDGQIDPSQTDFETRLVRYNLESVDGGWKIADYKTVDGSTLERAVNNRPQNN